MKRYVLIALLVAFALSMNVMFSQSASARPEYKARLDIATKESKAANAIKEAKCNTCHYGTSKKNRNDFGKAVNKELNADVYKKLKGGDKAEMEKKIDEGIKAAMKEKSKSGKTFGELIDSGSLPAENPADK